MGQRTWPWTDPPGSPFGTSQGALWKGGSVRAGELRSRGRSSESPCLYALLPATAFLPLTPYPERSAALGWPSRFLHTWPDLSSPVTHRQPRLTLERHCPACGLTHGTADSWVALSQPQPTFLATSGPPHPPLPRQKGANPPGAWQPPWLGGVPWVISPEPGPYYSPLSLWFPITPRAS